MKRNASLLVELNNLLNNIQEEIEAKNISLFQDELIKLKDIINDSLKRSHREVFFSKNPTVKAILQIMDVIDKAINSVELEMHGVANYSQYESKKVEVIAFIQVIKNQFKKMLDLILAARPEIRNEELAIAIKKMRG